MRAGPRTLWLSLLAVACGGGPGPAVGDDGRGTSGGERPEVDDLYGESTATPFARVMTARALANDDSLHPIAFLVRLEVGLSGDEAAERPTRTLRFGVVVTSEGLRVTELSDRDRTAEVRWPTLSELDELRPLAIELVEDVRASRIAARGLVEADRALVGDSTFDALASGVVAEVGLGDEQPIAARVVGAAIVARDPPNGRIRVVVIEP